MVDFLKEARKIEPEIIKTRREIHQRPELAYKEKATAKLVAEKLRGLGIEVRSGVGGTGGLGILRGPVTGRVVALRADMDALPIEEMADIDFRSKENGVMHASGEVLSDVPLQLSFWVTFWVGALWFRGLHYPRSLGHSGRFPFNPFVRAKHDHFSRVRLWPRFFDGTHPPSLVLLYPWS